MSRTLHRQEQEKWKVYGYVILENHLHYPVKRGYVDKAEHWRDSWRGAWERE